MKKTGLKTEKGITLVVLIVTIIVMLILSTIVFNEVINRSTIDGAKNEANKTNTIIENGQTDVDSILNEWNAMKIDNQTNFLNIIQESTF